MAMHQLRYCTWLGRGHVSTVLKIMKANDDGNVDDNDDGDKDGDYDDGDDGGGDYDGDENDDSNVADDDKETQMIAMILIFAPLPAAGLPWAFLLALDSLPS